MSFHPYTDKKAMKMVLILSLLFSFSAWSATGVKGQVASVSGCSNKVMVWVSLDKDEYKERLLLMHTEVPVGGSFQFYLKPGDYQLRASDELGCEFIQKVKVNDLVTKIQVKMVKK